MAADHAADPFDVFDSDAVASPARVSEPLQRAADHPHFWSCRGIWPRAAPAGEPHWRDALLRYSESRSEACEKGLRKSCSGYARSCARSLREASRAFAEDAAAGGAHARAVRELSAMALDEADWDVSEWQEANLLAIGYLLAALLAEAPADGGDASRAEAVGKEAIALFNLGVSTACGVADGLADRPAWMGWVGLLLAAAEAAVDRAWAPHSPAPVAPSGSPAWLIPTSPPPLTTPAISPSRRVREVACTELPCAAFFSEHLRPGTPVLIRGHLRAERWRALEYFASLEPLHAELGSRLVPVNLGSPLVGYRGVEHWPMRRLVESSLLPSNASHGAPPAEGAAADEESHCEVAYMSQHHLIHQHEPLQQLLAVPPYCVGRPLSPANMWIGSRGTVTSLHSDPGDNLLCQAAGFKYFRLYGLDQTPRLSATTLRAKNSNSFGTSDVRVEAPLPAEHAAFGDAEFVEGILEPGDMLFIPKSMWHYIRSLTTSVSVNFWF